MRLRAKVEELTDRAEIAKHLKLDFPVPTATMSAKRIEAEINFSIDRRVEDRFAGALTTQLEQEAIEKFPLAEIGDDVEAVDIRRGIVTGKLLRNHPAYVDVGGRRVSKVDLSKESMAFFDEDANLQIRERHVRRQLQAQRNRKHEITIEMRKTLSKEMYLANNYVRYKGKWITATEMMDIAVKYRRKKLVKKYSKAIQGEVYSEHDYVKQDGVWIKPDEIPIVDIKIPTNDILPDQPPTGGNGPDEVVPPWEQAPPLPPLTRRRRRTCRRGNSRTRLRRRPWNPLNLMTRSGSSRRRTFGRRVRLRLSRLRYSKNSTKSRKINVL